MDDEIPLPPVARPFSPQQNEVWAGITKILGDESLKETLISVLVLFIFFLSSLFLILKIIIAS